MFYCMPETASFIPRRAEALALQGFGAWLLAGFFLLSTREETHVQVLAARLVYGSHVESGLQFPSAWLNLRSVTINDIN
jgi:hypothetical protein